MAKRKSSIKCLLISTPKSMDFVLPVLKEVIVELKAEIQLDIYAQSDRSIVLPSAIGTRSREKDFVNMITSADLVLIDLTRSSQAIFFEIGVARAIGKPVVFMSEDVFFISELPDFIRQSYFILYKKKNDLQTKLKSFLKEYLESPKRFTPRSLIEQDTSSQIIVDLEKLDKVAFENLCFELLSRLGYKELEWKIKDDFIDAVSTLHKKDPDGFEYDEYWLISFANEYKNKEMFDIALHEPEYFAERVFRYIFEPGMMKSGGIMQEKMDVPITLLFVLRGKENYPKKLIKELSRRDYRIRGRGFPAVRIRWWDEQNITSLVQNNLQLARKYFSSEALARSSTRLSYEELYKQYADTNEELEKTIEVLKSERSKVESLERDAAWKLLSFVAAHRLGNPVDAIDADLSNLKVALEIGNQDKIKDIVSSMDSPVEKAKLIVSEFRSLSTSQVIKPEIIKSEKLDEILKYSAKAAIDKNVKVEFALKKLPDISADEQKLSDCFGELIRNSLHFIEGKNPKIVIATRLPKKSELPDKIDKTKDYILIIFSDNGCGVPLAKKKLIFKAFETSYVHGTGLGLSICESIIEKHGGKIRETGKPKDGAIFEIFLPITTTKK